MSDTPRTDEAKRLYDEWNFGPIEAPDPPYKEWELCRQLERELNAAYGLLREARQYIDAYLMQCDTIGGVPHAKELATRIDAATQSPK